MQSRSLQPSQPALSCSRRISLLPTRNEPRNPLLSAFSIDRLLNSGLFVFVAIVATPNTAYLSGVRPRAGRSLRGSQHRECDTNFERPTDSRWKPRWLLQKPIAIRNILARDSGCADSFHRTWPCLLGSGLHLNLPAANGLRGNGPFSGCSEEIRCPCAALPIQNSGIVSFPTGRCSSVGAKARLGWTSARWWEIFS